MNEVDKQSRDKQPEPYLDAQDHILEPEHALPPVTLADLPESIVKAAARAGWGELMPVQAKTIPYILSGRDMMVQSRTGSGKTGAFVLPLLGRLKAELDACQALILVPTRELALQVATEVKTLLGDSGFRSVAVYGGGGYGAQMDAFRAGAHVVVGTPGRVLDHLLRRTLTLDRLQVLIFDEADRMLSMGFYPDMKQVQRYLPKHRINGYMFSATYPPHVLNLAREFLHQPEMLSLSRDVVHVPQTEQAFYVCMPMEKDRSLVRIIEIENPASAIIFCNTKADVHFVCTVLQRFGYDADELSADLAQRQRERLLDRVRQGALRFLVATDLAARGLDIPALSHVIQFQPPEDPEAYIHRAGRTGRAGASGVAISLVAGQEQTDLRRIASRFGIDMIQRQLPTAEDVAAVVAERMTVILESQLRERDKLQIERMERFMPLVKRLMHEEEGHPLLAMLPDDYYQKTLHAPLFSPAQLAAAMGDTPQPQSSDDNPRRRRRSSGGKPKGGRDRR